MPYRDPESQNLQYQPCPRCSTVDRPTLSAGTGPHSCKATFAHCGRFLKWISLLAPSERMARKLAARRQAMLKHPASLAQLAFLEALGYEGPVPSTMAEASERIEELKAQAAAKRSDAPGEVP